jgi:CRISPR-associated protein Cmr3
VMGEAVTISFKVVEPMMFRGPGEFDPFVRGAYSRGASLALPLPSTIAGVLATYGISKLGRPVPSSGDWIEQYLEVLGKDVRIRGALIRLNNELMAEDRLSRGFLNMEKVREKCEIVWRRLGRSCREECREGEFEPSVKIKKSVRVGIMLETRGKVSVKRAREGFLYGAEYVDYVGATAGSRSLSVEIVAEVRGGIAESLSPAQKLPIRFGGEGRIALLSFRKGGEILDGVVKQLWSNRTDHHGVLALYLATPALFETGKSVKERLNEWIKDLGRRARDVKLIGLSGESSVLGTGFMLKERRRKPIYISLDPGSIIFLEGDFSLPEIYQEGVGVASMLGYGTVIPVPMSHY